jgi:hypothetical protein
MDGSTGEAAVLKFRRVILPSQVVLDVRSFSRSAKRLRRSGCYSLAPEGYWC